MVTFSFHKGAVTLGNFSCNLSRNFVVPLRDKLHATLLSVTPLRNAGKIRCSVARIVAKSRTDFYFSQRLRQQKSCETGAILEYPDTYLHISQGFKERGI